jgi:hypothetical protein
LGAMDANTGYPVPNPLFENESVKSRRQLYTEYSWLFGKRK